MRRRASSAEDFSSAGDYAGRRQGRLTGISYRHEQLLIVSGGQRAALCERTGFGCSKNDPKETLARYEARHGRPQADDRSPVILFPGLAGSGLECEIDKNYGEWVVLWSLCYCPHSAFESSCVELFQGVDLVGNLGEPVRGSGADMLV